MVWWIASGSPARIEQSLADLALRLIPAWADSASTEARAAWAMMWLQWHPRWLLVFGNVEDPADLRPYIGTADGYVIATSRRSTGWPTSAVTLALDVLDPAEASKLLCRYAFGGNPPAPRQMQEAQALAADLGQLPLALEQAGAYLAQNPAIGIDRYRRRLIGELDKAPDGIDPERTIARIWSQTVGTLSKRDHLTVSVLYTLAWLAPDDIPVELMAPVADDSDDLHEGLGILGVYCMVSLTRNTVSVHRLVQAVIWNQLPPDGTASADRPGRPGRLEA
ncbi:hypothetical protein [Streptomyces sp. NPDC014894]|uniref:hypothetical protein n=1 Tax=Streptomyces sp. NPDC014894 TaxID=3364931 RepID=UPI00370297FD